MGHQPRCSKENRVCGRKKGQQRALRSGKQIAAPTAAKARDAVGIRSITSSGDGSIEDAGEFCAKIEEMVGAEYCGYSGVHGGQDGCGGLRGE
ncbi:hypothetical protein NDU88_005931 [Pleurodeles waltl]|uniref:Uncharacterized protein n=1 Tax=Pleurodeles waltl TaxID=8319 RepID=A0AAV7WZP3_PLEWA|nr:hypothetical protein NDU88_005931 [Pleurodeles waltl]